MKRILSLILCFIIWVIPLSAIDPAFDLNLYFIDVGQGDAALIECGGETLLIDGGGAKASSVLYAFLKDLGIRTLDYIILTHPHEDHAGGLSGALHTARAGTVYSPVTEYHNDAFRAFVKYLGEQDKAITIPESGDTFRLGSADVRFLSPIAGMRSVNNQSLIVMVTHNAIRILFTGDAEREAETALLNAGYELSADVLCVGHHGSDSSTIYPFLKAVMPAYAVISCGAGNLYGHPHENTLSRLWDAGAAVYRTDLNGHIHITSNGETLMIEGAR